MKNIFTLFIILSLAACTPRSAKNMKEQMVENPTTQADKDQNLIIDHAVNKKLDLTRHDSGIYYSISNPGEGDARPGMSSQITAHYAGTLLNGQKFDSSFDRDTPLDFKLGQVVKGWQIAIPLLGKGGKGTFFIPSGLAYGERAAGPIPPNSVLVFEIELIDFK